jgi:hypothetical protein
MSLLTLNGIARLRKISFEEISRSAIYSAARIFNYHELISVRKSNLILGQKSCKNV